MIRSADELFQVYLKHGDPVLLGRTYDLVSPGLLTLALHVRPDPDLAEDLVHDVFLKAIEQAHEWNGETPFTAWMVSLLAAEIEVSKGTPQPPGSLVDLEEGQALPEERGPLAQAQISELNLQLDQAIEKLPERYQCVVRMGIREGLDSMTIGETLQRSPGTVRSQLARGLDRLRQLLPSALSLGLLCGLDRSSMTSHAFGSQALRRRILDSADLVPVGVPIATVASTWLKALGVGTLAAGLAALTYFAASGEETSPVLASAGEPNLEFTGQSSAREAALVLPNTQERHTGDHRDPTSTGLRSQIVGRVMDKDGQPIVGARARLLDRRAQSELDHPVIYREVQTDDQGFYNLSLATKDAEGLELGIQHSDNMSAVHFPFGNPDHGTTPIWPGTNDLGTTTLFPAACVRGRILNADGTPAHPALVVLRPGCNPSTGSLIETAEDGSFVAPGLVLGEHGFRVYQGTAVTELPSISVASGDRLQMQDRWLPTHEAISVTVVNPEGDPIEDAKVSIADANGVRVPHWDAARTDALGQATAQAPVGEGRSIHVLAVGYRLAEPMALPPGTTQRIITMQRQGTQSFRPIDAMTGEPLTSFQVKVERRSPAGDWNLASPPWATSATDPGPATVSFEAGDRFGIYSKGYQEVVRVMEYSEPGILDVPLRPSPRIEGRVTLDGKPAPGVVLELSAGSVDPEFHRVPESDRGPHFLPQKSCIAWARTDEQGRFTVDTFELQLDQYALHASLGPARAGLAWIRLEEGSLQTVQVGDLELVETGSIRGQVLVPPGFLVSGLGLSVDALDGPLGINVDPMGHFELNGVLPGRHALVVEPVGEIRAGNTKNFVHVNAGQTAEIVVDLSGLGVAFRPLELTLDGSPLVFHDTFMIPKGLVNEGEIPSEPLLHKHYFGSTDADGMVNGSAPCSGPAELWVLNPRTRKFMRHPSARIELDCTPTARMRFEFSAI